MFACGSRTPPIRFLFLPNDNASCGHITNLRFSVWRLFHTWSMRDRRRSRCGNKGKFEPTKQRGTTSSPRTRFKFLRSLTIA